MSARLQSSMRRHGAQLLLVCLLSRFGAAVESSTVRSQRATLASNISVDRLTPMYTGIGTDGPTPVMDLGWSTHENKNWLVPVRTTMRHARGVPAGLVNPRYDDDQESASYFNTDRVRNGKIAGISKLPNDLNMGDKEFSEINHKNIVLPENVRAGDTSFGTSQARERSVAPAPVAPAVPAIDSRTSKNSVVVDSAEGEKEDAKAVRTLEDEAPLGGEAKDVSAMPGEDMEYSDNSGEERADAKPVTAARVRAKKAALARIPKKGNGAKTADDAAPKESEVENTLAETKFRQMFPTNTIDYHSQPGGLNDAIEKGYSQHEIDQLIRDGYQNSKVEKDPREETSNFIYSDPI